MCTSGSSIVLQNVIFPLICCCHCCCGPIQRSRRKKKTQFWTVLAFRRLLTPSTSDTAQDCVFCDTTQRLSWSRQLHHCERLKICVRVSRRYVFRHFTWHTSFCPQFRSADQGERWNVMKYATTTSSYQGWPARRVSRASCLGGNWGNARASIKYNIFPF